MLNFTGIKFFMCICIYNAYVPVSAQQLSIIVYLSFCNLHSYCSYSLVLSKNGPNMNKYK